MFLRTFWSLASPTLPFPLGTSVWKITSNFSLLLPRAISMTTRLSLLSILMNPRYCFTFGFEQVQDWWSINDILLASSSPLDEFKVSIQSSSSLSTSILQFFLLLYTSSNIFPLQTLPCFIKVYACLGARFSVNESKQFQENGFYLLKNGLILNFTDEADQLMSGDVLWRGPQEKH